jgi:hypothetical protein
MEDPLLGVSDSRGRVGGAAGLPILGCFHWYWGGFWGLCCYDPVVVTVHKANVAGTLGVPSARRQLRHRECANYVMAGLAPRPCN